MEISALSVVIVLAIIIGSVVLHELAHGLMAYWLGDDTAKVAGRLSFNPIKHIDPFMSILVPVVLYLLHAPVFGGAKPVPINFSRLKWNEWGMALVAVAGPLTNFLIAFIAYLVGSFTGLIQFEPSGGLYFAMNSIPAFVVVEIILINLGFMIFNLIPIPPLDGSRILYAIAPDGFRNVLNMMERYGFVIVYMMIFLFGEVFSHIMTGGMQGILSFFYWLVGAR